MNKQRKLLFFIIGFFTVLIFLIIYRYEKLLDKARVEGGFGEVAGGLPSSTKYNAGEIIGLIRNSKEYLGDTIAIYDNGDLKSSNSKFQGTIQAVVGSKDNMEMVRSSTANNKLPLQYNIYVLAATFYRNQYAAEFAQPAK